MRAEQVQGLFVCSASIALGVVLLLPETHQPAGLRDWSRRLGRYRIWLALSVILLGVVMVINTIRH